MVQSDPDIAVALVDVVMESEDAGLRLVEQLRGEGHRCLRIVLRTGQPGYAPETEILSRYDINDYRTKSELDHHRLFSVLTASVRSYRQILELDQTQKGLRRIVEGTSALFDRVDLECFTAGIVAHVAALLEVRPSGFVAMTLAPTDDEARSRAEDMMVVCDAGRFAGSTGRSLAAIPRAELELDVEAVLANPRPLTVERRSVTVTVRSGDGDSMLIHVDADECPSESKRSMLEVFANNIAMAFENLRLLDRLDGLAFLDPTLGVPNDNAFRLSLEERLRSEHGGLNVGLVELDTLDSIASAVGPSRANQVLAAVYVQLWQLLPGLHMAARFGDKTFAFVCDQPSPDADALRALFAAPYVVEGASLAVRATTGLVSVNDRDSSAEDVLRRAQAALIHARDRGSGEHAWFEESLHARIDRRVQLHSALMRALQREEGFHVYVQPKVDTSSGEVVGGEALARWTLEGAPISPGEFIPVAEAYGLSGAILSRVLANVGAWSRGWRRGGRPPLPIAVNVSMPDLIEPHFADRMLRLLDTEGLGSSDVAFEITESGLMRDHERITRELQTLVAHGFSIAIDDFGTGYSSLAQLERLPVDTLKIDRAFVNALSVTNARKSIAAATIAIARGLDLKVIAEGIETAEQHAAIRSLGCTECQGFLYGRPVPIETFSSVLPEGHRAAV